MDTIRLNALSLGALVVKCLSVLETYFSLSKIPYLSKNKVCLPQ